MKTRGLTPGERAGATRIFGDALDCATVRLHYRPFFFLQPRGMAMAPRGAIHFHAAELQPDFSVHWRGMAWLIHELVHVWQYRTGQWVLLRGMYERRYRYGRLDPGRRFERRGIEQQAAIVEDWFRITRGHAPYRGTGSDADYRAAIPFV